MQTPGSFLLCWTISSSPGTRWSTWLSYAIGGTLQGVLLFTVIWRKYFENHSEEEPVLFIDSQSVEEDLKELTGTI